MKMHILCALIALGLIPNLFAQSEERSAINGQVIDPLNPPDHLRKSALVRFMQRRNTELLPFPLLRLVRELSYEDFAPVRAFVPRGRSAQLENTDEFFPRKVIASYGANKIPNRAPIGFENYSKFRSPDWEGQLFFGHADKEGTLESLSLNIPERRFDYFVITNYGSDEAGRPLPTKITEVKNRDACTKCHQNEAPIYPPQPWAEMVTHDPRRFFEAELNMKPIDFDSPPELYTLDGVLVSRELTPFVNNTNLAIGFSVLVGNRLLQAYDVFSTLCGHSKSCKRTLLLAALTNPNQSNFIRKNVAGGGDITALDVTKPYTLLRKRQVPDYFRENLRYLDRNWSVTDYSYITGFIPDISTVVNGSLDPVFADPQAPRAPGQNGIPRDLMAQYVYDVAFDAFGFSYRQERELKRYRTEDLTRLIRNSETFPDVEADLDALFQNWLPDPDDIMAFIRRHLNAPSGDTQVVFNAENPFLSYCQHCHQANTGNPEINFQNPAVLDDPTKGLISDYLSDGSMPPEGELHRPTEPEVRTMLGMIGIAASGIIGGERDLGHLNIPILRRSGQKYSYVIDHQRVSVEEGHAVIATVSPTGTACELRSADNSDEPSALIAGQTPDKGFLLALENFPRFIAGNLIQTIVLGQGGVCRAFALTRNGQGILLRYDERLLAKVEVPVTFPKPIRYIATDGTNTFGIGFDQIIYRLEINSENGSVVQIPVTVRDSVSLSFARLRVLRGDAWLGQSFKGERYVLRLRSGMFQIQHNYRTPVINQRASGYTGKNVRFSGNLLDGVSWLVMPGTYTPFQQLAHFNGESMTVRLERDAVAREPQANGYVHVDRGMKVSCEKNGRCRVYAKITNKSFDKVFSARLLIKLAAPGRSIDLLNRAIKIGPRKQIVYSLKERIDLTGESWQGLLDQLENVSIDLSLTDQRWEEEQGL